MQLEHKERSVETRARSVIKALTWRITGSVDTIVLAYCSQMI
jgi:hypothetical protein